MGASSLQSQETFYVGNQSPMRGDQWTYHGERWLEISRDDLQEAPISVATGAVDPLFAQVSNIKP
jgi:hypothetical protein